MSEESLVVSADERDADAAPVGKKMMSESDDSSDRSVWIELVSAAWLLMVIAVPATSVLQLLIWSVDAVACPADLVYVLCCGICECRWSPCKSLERD